MDSEVSISKGVFVYPNGFKRKSDRKKITCENMLSMYENVSPFSEYLWYNNYQISWKEIEEKLTNLNRELFSNVLSDVVNFIKNRHQIPTNVIPSACLLTGINVPDHNILFDSLMKMIENETYSHVISLNGEGCQNIKLMITNMIDQFINQNLEQDSDDDNEKLLKKSQYTMMNLLKWYNNLNDNKSPKKMKKNSDRINLIIILPDFENFDENILEEFILIISSYINWLPFVLIFGVATSLSTLYRSLSYHVSSKINIKVFNLPPATNYLNSVIENVFFHCSFHLSGNIFHLLTDIFLLYDLSVSGFIKNFKYSMLEHFCYGNAMALCTFNQHNLLNNLTLFSHNDFENCRQLLSFRKYVENETPENQIKLLTDDDYFKDILNREINKIQIYLKKLHILIKCLYILVNDLPKAPLGKQIREIYPNVIRKNFLNSPEYIECFQLLKFQSCDELKRKCLEIIELIDNNRECDLLDVCKQLIKLLNKSTDNNPDNSNNENDSEMLNQKMNRLELKEKLFRLSKNKQNKYENTRSDILNLLSKLFEFYFIDYTTLTFHEIFFFDDLSIKNHIMGSQRAAIHSALIDPNFYLQCDCCNIKDTSAILPSMPDICILYKLHLECGKMINLYDWLQAFLSIINNQDPTDDPTQIVDPLIQARFTQAVAELEFLGFIKSSKRKVDHVSRLTWGG